MTGKHHLIMRGKLCPTIDRSSDTSLAVINGVPAISYCHLENVDLKFIRATDANGSAWGTPLILDSTNFVGAYTSLAVINGVPAISYLDRTNTDLKFIRATDAGGTIWNAPQTLDSIGRVGWTPSLAMVNGTPAISYYDDGHSNLKFIHAVDANGTSWNVPQTLDSTGFVGAYTSLVVVNGSPAISYCDGSNYDLKYIRSNGTVDFSVSPYSTGDTLDFGSTTLGEPITEYFEIRNNGTATLNLNSLVLPEGFSLLDTYQSEFSSGRSITIQIRLDALQTGTFSGDLEITNTDTNQSPFIITLIGEVTTSNGEIAVFDGATEIVDNTGSVNYGTTVLGTPLSHTFTVQNSSSEDLELYSLTLPTGFRLSAAYDHTVASGRSTNITIQLDSQIAGSYNGDFSLSTNDADENPFNFTISGEVTTSNGEITVFDGATEIVDNTGSVNYGTTVLGTPLSHTFTVQNSSSEALELYSLTLPAGFSLSGAYNHTIASGGSTNITIQLDSQIAGSYNGDFSLSTNDADENPFNFTISGEVTTSNGEITVFDGATEIVDNTGSVNYGTTVLGTPLSHTFTVQNSSSEDLELYSLTLPTGFSLSAAYDHTVASGRSTNITVQLDGMIAGSYNGDFSLSTNDADENPFNFTISGVVDNPLLETGIIAPLSGSTVINSDIQVSFNHDVLHDGSADAANNPVNYLLVEDGSNGLFETTTCLLGLAGDDIQAAIGSVSYDDSTFTSTINAGTLSSGRYRLFVCGTASIADATGNVLNNGAFDSTTTFTVVSAASGAGTAGAAGTALLPATGFAPDQTSVLPAQPASLAYNDLNDLTLQIPSLKVDVPIVGVPKTSSGWDVTWLTSAQAGWLNGTAYPTWAGNTVLTGHVTNTSGNPGPFANIKSLKFGDKITIQAYGEECVYEVRENKLVTHDNMRVIEKHEDHDWITLITCEYFNETTGEYLFRRVVRAVLVEVE